MMTNSSLTSASLTPAPTRRSLVAGVATAVCAAATVASPLAARASEAPAWDIEAEVVVVGSGAAGISAAVAAIEAGASVVMVEKWDTLGGISASCVQFCAYDSSLHTPQPFADVTDDAEQMFAASMEASGNTADPAFLRVICETSPDVIDWMVAHGCEFKEALRPSDGRRGQGKYITATPGELVSKLMPLVQEQGRVLAGHRLAEIVYDSRTARVTGVVCETPDGPVRIGATSGVVICSGPWPDDEVLGTRHLPAAMGEMPAAVAQTMVSMGMPFGPYTGEAVRAAQKIGAAVRHMEYVMPDPYYAVPELMLQRVAAFGVSRSVNQVLIGADGRRFTDEGKMRGAIAVDVMNQPGSVCYPVTDGHIVPSQLQMGGSVEAMEQWAADGHVARGETLEELAANMEELFGTPADEMLATLTRYNEFCAAGSDDDFGKDPHYLAPYDQPPFYAGPAETCRYLYTHGGLDTDLQAQVQAVDGTPIAGLYAAGMCTGGHLGTDTISGNWQLDAVVFGRIAGANAAAAAC